MFEIHKNTKYARVNKLYIVISNNYSMSIADSSVVRHNNCVNLI